jgi:hypothetical protein
MSGQRQEVDYCHGIVFSTVPQCCPIIVLRINMVPLISFFEPRVEETIRSWPSLIKNAVQSCLHLPGGKTGHVRKLDRRVTDQPYWILMPFWLADRFARIKGRNISTRCMDDILWAQYCLFLFIRMQDDLFDTHTRCLPLIYASDSFLFEAERIFTKYFPKSSPFWKIYLQCIEETIFAVASADDLESRSVRSSRRLLSHYGRTSTICNIAAAAVCLKSGKRKTFSRIELFSRELMMAGAIVDDLLDMEEDLARGRFNYAIPFFLPKTRMKKSLWKKNVRLIASNFRDGKQLSEVFREIYRHLARAEKAVSPVAVPGTIEYLRSYRRSLERLMDFMLWQKTNRDFLNEAGTA